MRFAFRLAQTLNKTVKELCEDLGQEEFGWWLAYNQVDPLPDPWLQTGIIASTIANASTIKGKFKPSDFIPKRKLVYRQSPEEMLATCKLFAIHQNSKISK